MRRFVFVVALGLLAACGGDQSVSTTTSAPPVTSVPPLTTTTIPSTTVTSTTVPPTLAEPPVFDRWTTILASLPVDEYDEAAATVEAFTLAAEAPGLLLSDDYPSLNPGYWVVFSGDFATQEEALAHCRALQEQDVFCYHRFLGEAPVVVAGRSEGTLVAWVDDVLAVVDARTGEVVVESATDGYAGGGVFPGSLELGTDGTGVYFGVGFEDSWYSCEASAGRIDYVDLTTGDATTVGAGFQPRISPDGSRLAYIASGACVPDPDNQNEVISYYDTVAVLDLVTGRVQTWGPSPGVAQTPESLIASIAWGADGTAIYVAMEEGSLRRIDTKVGAALDAVPAFGPGRTEVSFGAWVLEGVHGETGRLIGVEVDYGAGRSRVIELDALSGQVLQARAWRDGDWSARLDGSRTALLLSSLGVVTGAPVGDLGPTPFFTGADW